MKTVWVVIVAAMLSGNAFAKGAKRPVRRAKVPVTVIDLASPSEPDSAFPAVAKKGHL